MSTQKYGFTNMRRFNIYFTTPLNESLYTRQAVANSVYRILTTDVKQLTKQSVKEIVCGRKVCPDKLEFYLIICLSKRLTMKLANVATTLRGFSNNVSVTKSETKRRQHQSLMNVWVNRQDPHYQVVEKFDGGDTIPKPSFKTLKNNHQFKNQQVEIRPTQHDVSIQTEDQEMQRLVERNRELELIFREVCQSLLKLNTTKPEIKTENC